MPLVISKHAHAIGAANCSDVENHQSQCGNGIDENEPNHFLDPNLADIIYNIILKLN